ncbi:MAG: SdiA-regulated domain-containing protein [Alphaproteobacteria bacterium]|nr:SdiA-regulated domain-containing protein [Alphaproteobacteria bacterium]MBU0794551.1 SdiA-regulated domain-containing protein [Alphaproteobacteria bacterium]MBU0877057.1 SdiA-regulated domain-containing protein [Alphaproteobacteria bacterium]MBU1768483.1 SdiA-regulated domain-containing protein [Alphaproteobacteria bacterium]
MKMMFLRAGIAMFAFSAASANAAGLLDNYVVGFSKAIDTKEASAVAYNWDTGRLMVTNDEEEADGTNIWGEYDLNGNKTANIVLSGCLSLGADQCDPEGLTYVGGGQYVVAEERYQDIALLSEIGVDGSTRTYTSYPDAPTISVGADAGNRGLEGIAYNRVTGDYFGVKERTPETIWKISGADFGTETAIVTTLFDIEALPGLDRLSDIAVLSNGVFSGTAFGDNLLILSGRSFSLLEVTQAGEVVSSYDLSGFKSLVDPTNEGGKFEGVTLDEAGNIYLVSDDGDGPNQSYLVKLTYSGAVPEPETWAMMMGGFALIGSAMRRRKRVAIAFS